MKYIDSIHINGFRGFKDFKLSGLKDINILVGENRCYTFKLLFGRNLNTG